MKYNRFGSYMLIMRYNIWVLIFLLFFGLNVFSQEKFIQHTVSKGETVGQIAQQYKIKPSVIYEINPDAKKGVKFESVLLIPVAASNAKSADKNELPNSELIVTIKKHLVLPKETLYGITKKYSVTVDDLYTFNPSLKKTGLQKGIVIKIPIIDSNLKSDSEVNVSKTSQSVSSQVASGNQVVEIIREVLPKETKFGIAREYNISITDLEKANPILETESLKIGQKLIIPVKSKVSITVTQENKVTENNETENKGTEKEIIHEVLPKETKYGIAKEFGISVKELERQNPHIAKRLLIGDKLTIRTSKNIAEKVSRKDLAKKEVNEEENISYNNSKDFIDKLISKASENIGVPYLSGGTTKDGFDCSGLMCSTFGIFDIELPRTSLEQSKYGEKISLDEAQKGDLIFFKTNGRRRINHVGMIVEVTEDDIKFIHASSSSGVIISSVKEKYYSKRFTQINRVL